MAHRGHDYPLAFRRDFNLNVRTYQHGLAERYLTLIDYFGTGILKVVNGFTFDCGPAAAAGRLMTWESAPHAFAGTTLRLRMTMDLLLGAPTQALHHLELVDSIAGVVSQIRESSSTVQSFWDAASGWTTPVPNLPWVRVGDGWSARFFKPKPY